MKHYNTQNMNYLNLADHDAIYLVRLALPIYVGYTLYWVGDPDDLVMVSDRKLLLFRKLVRLHQFVREGSSCNIRDTSRYSEVPKRYAKTKANNTTRFNYVTTGALFQTGYNSEWKQPTTNYILDHLNFIFDIGHTLDNQEILTELMHSDAEDFINSLGSLANVLTAYAVPWAFPEPVVKPAGFDWPDLYQRYLAMMNIIQANITLL